MNRSRAAFGLFCLIVGSAALFAVQGGAPSPLDGMRFKVKVTPDAAAMKKGEHKFDDILIFRDGKVEMSECVKVGFAASEYTATAAGDGWSFETLQTSDKSGKNVWTAQVRGESIHGTLDWSKPDGTEFHYTFEGKKLAK